MSTTGREYSWDDQIEKDSEFILLPEGDYDFEVMSFERGRHAGSDKLPPCNKAILAISKARRATRPSSIICSCIPA
jgi:hypothetical protein